MTQLTAPSALPQESLVPFSDDGTSRTLFGADVDVNASEPGSLTAQALRPFEISESEYPVVL